MAISANATFPGISVILGCDGTLTHGISPSIFTIRTIPHTNFVAGVGNLTLSFGSDSLTFRDCALDLATLEVNEGGSEWTLNILDRRWKWQYGEISGWYNRRLEDGTIDKETEKNPQELATLLLEAMGEQRSDVSALPMQPRPEVRWQFDNPAEELASLCDELKCRIVLGLDNRVRLWKLGDGKDLPQGGTVSGGGRGFDTSVMPSALKIVGGPIRYQSKLKLEAVGEDTDGKIKLIDDLSYKPDGGWESLGEDLEFFAVTDTYKIDGVEVQCRELAKRSVYRWYRIKEQAEGGLKPPGFDGTFKIEKREQLLPLGNGLIDATTDPDGRTIPKPPEITGEWYGFGEDDEPITRGSRYRDSFSVDAATGVVRFSNPVYLLDEDDSTIQEAELYLTTSYSITDPATRGLYHFTRERKTPRSKAKTKPLIIRRPEIDRTIKQYYDQVTKPRGNPADNRKVVEKESDHYLDAAMKEFETDETLTLEYAGLVFLGLDGLTSQVSWTLGNGQAAVTKASQGDEHDIYTPSYAERRRTEADKSRADFNKTVNRLLHTATDSIAKFARGFIS